MFMQLARTQSFSPSTTTAWHDGQFNIDVAGVISRSNIHLGRANTLPNQAMPLGNGRLGVAIWSANGLTAQLNRVDTLPYRYSPGKLVIPGLSTLATAKDYSGRLDLYNGDFQEQGGGMTVTAYVQPHTDLLIVDITGANPDRVQIAQLQLWAPRTAHAAKASKLGTLSQTWIDNKEPGASGRTFGSLSAITAQGRNISVVVTNPLTLTVSVKPYADGHFRILVAAPHYDGTQNVQACAQSALLHTSAIEHVEWWNAFWHRVGTIKISSPHGAGEYMENLRNIYLFTAAAESASEYPGSQAGVGDLFSSVRDYRWDPAAFWHWNLRMQVAANIGAGVPELNAPYFNLYRENLANIEKWTMQHMAGRSGICVPETMRFNGQGIEYETQVNASSGVTGLDCDADFKPFYNARTLSTGSEVSLWVWRQYLATNDREFLAKNYPLMAASARFLLAYEKLGNDGLLHTSPSNSHEQKWDTRDPITDISARMALFPATIQAAKLLGKDPDLVRQLQAAQRKIPPFPRTEAMAAKTLLPPSTDAQGKDVIAPSYVPTAPDHNFENIGLEPIWPYSLIGENSPLFSLAKRTYVHRPYPTKEDWSFDPIQAARLGLGVDVRSTLIKITETYQQFINGLANWGGETGEFYVEQSGVVATALQEALVQDYDGVIRVAPAIPPTWDVDGTVYVRGNTKVDVQIGNGDITTLVIEAGMTGSIKLYNPWLGQPIRVVSSKGRTVVKGIFGQVITFPAIVKVNYLVEKQNYPTTKLSFVPVSGTATHVAKELGAVQIGLFDTSRR